MIQNIPRTPFSTRLSSSAKETEIRIRNIYSGPKKRPPIPLIILTVLMILLCGNLVAFRLLPAVPTIVMETQYYDRYANYVEVPVLALPAGERNDAVDAINAALNELRQSYAFAQDSVRGGNMCLFYPSTTDRYINLVFFQSGLVTDLNTGHVLSLVYDWKEGVQVAVEDALALAGLNEKALLDQTLQQVQDYLDKERQEHGYDFQLTLHNLTLEGFRIKADSQPVFYLTGRVDDVDDAVYDGVSGADHMFIWEGRALSTYEGEYGDPVLLVPAGELDKFDPPLWNQWYFAGEEPAGGFSPAPAASQSAADLRAVLLGSQFFTDVDTGLVLDISRVTETVASDASFTSAPSLFSYVDLDQDGTEEVVLQLATETDPALAFLVLRWQEGRVFSYLRFPRTLERLKLDGGYEYSLSGGEFGISFPRFVPGELNGPDRWESEVLLRQELLDGNWDRPVWYYGEGQVSEADFNFLCQEQRDKPDAPWYNFAPEVIEQVIM